MTITAKVVLDSIAPNGARLTTFELTYPRLIHAELMTHRVFSRNAASSRAIPTPKKIERIRADCAKPSEWGVNQKGMQSPGPLSEADAGIADYIWSQAMCDALRSAELLCGVRCATCGKLFNDELPLYCGGQEGTSHHKLDLHKQVANRILEPFDHITTVLSTTKLRNHFLLRLAVDENGRPLPDPTYFELATKWKAAFDASTPWVLEPGGWHLPYVSQDLWVQEGLTKHVNARIVTPEDMDLAFRFCETLEVKKAGDYTNVLKMVSAARCARVSYMRQGQGDVAENKVLHDRLVSGGHWAPLEHVATPMGGFSFGLVTDDPTADCDFCGGTLGQKCVSFHNENVDTVCMKCAHGHIHSGNFHGWNQYRKEFEGEAGGD